MARVIFTIQPHSIVDLITNSSTELFVGKAKDESIMIQMVREVYPDYEQEYTKPIRSDKLTRGDINTYLCYRCHYWSNSQQKMVIKPLPGFTLEEMTINGPNDYNYELCTESNHTRILDAIDPKREMYFMFSHDDNPDWEMQEELMTIMERYHLG